MGSTVDSRIQKFLDAERRDCERLGVEIDLRQSEVKLGKDVVGGYFDDHPKPILVVDVRDQIEHWLPIFVHESCHKDQFAEKAPVWTRKFRRFDASDMFDMWLEGVVELKPNVLRGVVRQIIDLEHDCERRSIEKIARWDLPLNVEDYTRKANAYVLGHHAMEIKRKWLDFYNPAILRVMPKTLIKNPRRISDSKLETILAHS